MPVEDHPIHEKVVHEKPPAGCYNRREIEALRGYHVLVRDYRGDGTYSMRIQTVQHMMSTKCRQVLPLPECEGCTTPKDHEYIERMGKLK